MRILYLRKARRAIATAEMAFILPVLLGFLVGLWEVGRGVMVQNVLNNAAREAARLSASGALFTSNNKTNPNISGANYALSLPSTNADCELQKKVLAYLQVAGISTTGASVVVTNSGTSSKPKTWSYTYSQDGTITGSGSDPAVAATQLDTLTATINLPYSNVQWSSLGWFMSSTTTMTATASWSSMNDIPLTISTTIPSKPLGANDALP